VDHLLKEKIENYFFKAAYNFISYQPEHGPDFSQFPLEYWKNPLDGIALYTQSQNY
jgi:hypothetical protein